MGIGFDDRNDAFEFTACLQDVSRRDQSESVTLKNDNLLEKLKNNVTESITTDNENESSGGN